jgi:hypothetical protein
MPAEPARQSSRARPGVCLLLAAVVAHLAGVAPRWRAAARPSFLLLLH